MAPSSGHVLVPKVIKAFRFAINKTASFVRSRATQAGAAVEAVPARITTRHPIHPLAALRQSRSQQRNFSTAIRRIAGLVSSPAARTVFPTSAVRTALSKTTHAPFTSPLRPNLTGGAIPRSAGGYSLGGQGVRHFSHTPAANAQVINNVSAAVRAFCYNGFSARYDGNTALGEKKYRAVTVKQEKAFNQIKSVNASTARGTSLEFKIAPTITALAPLAAEHDTLENATIIPGLASDFARNLSTLARVHEDLKRLQTLGPLPISSPNPYTISVRFPGCDATLVTALCDELSISRGIIMEDPSWTEDTADKDVEMALLFPWAPSKAVSIVSEDEGYKYFNPVMEWKSMLSPPASNLPSSPQEESEKSLEGFSLVERSNPWRDNESFEDVGESDLESNGDLDLRPRLSRTQTNVTVRPDPWTDRTSYDGIEGIYKFIAECDAAGRR